MKDDKREPQPDAELPDDVADAWVAVSIDIHEERRGEARADQSE